MTMIKPMLGVAVDTTKLVFPVYASPKLDGIRVIIKDGKVLSRNGKPIPNLFIQSLLKTYHGLDGELIVGHPTHTNVFQLTTSGVMSIEGTPNVRLYVFDCWYAEGGIDTRYNEVLKITQNSPISDIEVVPQIIVNSLEELYKFEEDCLEKGYEGVMLRYPNAPYKNGRSTVKEGALLKLKRFSDSEAYILDMEPLLRNHNEPTKNALGHTERSSHIYNKVADNLLGALNVKDIHTGVEFSIGSGFTEEQRREIWNKQVELIGSIVKYKYFEIGVKDKPRFPIFCGFRDKRDMS